jgi:hypothetical protein
MSLHDAEGVNRAASTLDLHVSVRTSRYGCESTASLDGEPFGGVCGLAHAVRDSAVSSSESQVFCIPRLCHTVTATRSRRSLNPHLVLHHGVKPTGDVGSFDLVTLSRHQTEHQISVTDRTAEHPASPIRFSKSDKVSCMLRRTFAYPSRDKRNVVVRTSCWQLQASESEVMFIGAFRV